MDPRIKSPRDMTFFDLAAIIWRRMKSGRNPRVSILTRWHPNPWTGSYLTRKLEFDKYEKTKRIKSAHEQKTYRGWDKIKEAKRDAQRD
jgi:hypothetical protein